MLGPASAVSKRRLQTVEQWIDTLVPPDETNASRWDSVQKARRPSDAAESVCTQALVLEWLAGQPTLPLNLQLTVLAAAIDHRHNEVVEYLSKQNAEVRDFVCPLAALLDAPEVLKWARGAAFPWGEDTFKLAVLGGNIETLRWLLEQTPPCPWDPLNCILAAAEGGQLQQAQWILEQLLAAGCDICYMAAERGLVHALAWAWKHGLNCDSSVCLEAAARGQLAALQWLRSQSPPCPWDARDCALAAARKGHLSVVKWVVEQDSTVANILCWAAACLGLVDVLAWARDEPAVRACISETLCLVAASSGQLSTLQRFRNYKFPWNPGHCISFALKHEHMQVAQWVFEQEPSAISTVCNWAADEGTLSQLIWANARVPLSNWADTVWCIAAIRGKKEVFKWARAQNLPCSWNVVTCLVLACKHGHYDLAEWLLQQEPTSKLRESLCRVAASEGDVNTLLWARSLDPPCPCDLQRCLELAISSGVADSQLVRLLETEPNPQLDRNFCARIAREDRMGTFKSLLSKGYYQKFLRSGLSAGPRCARIARTMQMPLDKESRRRASDMFKQQIALSAGLQTFGVCSVDVAEKIGLLAGFAWV